MADDDYDLWDVLNLQKGATQDEVRVAFRELSRIYHPDKVAGRHNSASAVDATTSGGDREAFERVHRAYRILSDDALRSFYDRYGLPGVRLAETLSDDEDGPDNGNRLALVLPEDRLKDLEVRVHRLLRKHQELKVQRLLGLNGSFTLSLAAGPGPYGSHLRRRYRLQYCATTQSVQIQVFDRFRVSIGCVSHVQSNSGAGASKLNLGASTTVGSGTHVRASMNVTGSFPDGDFSVVRSVSPLCTVQQRIGFSKDGGLFSLTINPLLTKTLHGSLGLTFGRDPSVSIGTTKTSLSSGHTARVFLNLESGGGELGVQLKYKPVKGFSLKLMPAISPHGPSISAVCKKAAPDGLTKLHWALNVRLRSLSLRLTLFRCGLRFAIPLELWPEAAGPIPAAEFGLALLLWAAPPLIVRLFHDTAIGLSTLFSSRAEDKSNSFDTSGLEAARATQQRSLLLNEAIRHRAEEEACNGLVILFASYGREQDPLSCFDVTDCLMAKVRSSKLHISDAPKSTLLGFCDLFDEGLAEVDSPDSPSQTLTTLHIRYKFGGIEYSRTFKDRDCVLLP